MTRISLPALRSDDSLGYLAALGVLETLASVEGHDARLGWDGLGGSAVLVVDLADPDAVADQLRSVALRMRAQGRLVPADAALVESRRTQAERRARKEEGIEEKNDPMRGSPAVVRDRLLAVAALEREGDSQTARWAAGLLTMLAVDRQGTSLLTPLYAPVGQQVLSQLLGAYLDWATQEGVLREALVGWRRRPDSGANLDHRALRDGAWSARGGAENTAVPGATWLALMATPLFRQVGNGKSGEAVGWHRDRRSVRPRRLIWPVWTEPRNLPGVEVLLAHREVTRMAEAVLAQRRGAKAAVPKSSGLKALGVVALCSAARTPLGNADGPLRSTEVLWP